MALIGPEWAKIEDEQGRRRLFNDHDFVRREIVAAMDTNSLVIPVLLPGAEVPAKANLNAEIGRFGELQVLPLSSRHWADDVKALGDAIEAGLLK